ncbi:hypothetical protein [Niallia taxi]|uniref:hypothetical protein n=1 Tax=Niallia taxi TaxID=2499688 RepID=UPI00300AAE43
MISNWAEIIRMNLQANFNLDFSKVSESIKNGQLYSDISQFLDSIDNTIDREIATFLKILAENGYPPIEMTINDTIDVLELNNLSTEEREKRVKEYINSIYTQDEIVKIINHWDEVEWIDVNRKYILKDAIQANFEGRYNLSIPSLLPHLEGIIVEGLDFNSRMKPGELSQLIKSILDEEDVFDTALNNYYLDNILIGFTHGNAPRSFLSRHSILHGNDINYGNHDNSLKLILLLDYTIDKLEQYRKYKSQV